VGDGTTMCLYLPRFIGSMADADTPEVALPADHGTGETVLVIDDQPEVRGLIVQVLEQNGYLTMEAGDGPSGLKILQSDARVDLLITDVGLPGGMNGRQVADAARVARADLRVLFVTGYAENAVVGNGRLDPGMEIITKPFNIDNLSNKVREMLDVQAAR
jgi:CheY-like chemotaxis protein